MRCFFKYISGILFAFITLSNTWACGFKSTVVLGTCPVGELEPNVNPTTDIEKAIIQLSTLWTKHQDFKELKPYESII